MKRSVLIALGVLVTVGALVAGVLVGTRGGSSASTDSASPAKPSAPDPRAAMPAPGTCPDLGKYDPSLSGLPTATLEEKYAAKLGLPPQMARQVTDKMQAALYSLPPEKHACIYRVMLLTNLVPAGGAAPAAGAPAEAAKPAN